MISVKELLEKFSNLLTYYYDNLSSLSEYDTSGSLNEDWLQANWELLVEGLLGKEDLVLEVYGDGADCNGESSRVLYPNWLPTHKIICMPTDNNQAYDILNKRQLDTSQNEIVFDRFVSIGRDGWYYEISPFDKVLAEYAGEYVVLDFSNTTFKLQCIE